MHSQQSAFRAAVILGGLQGIWHFSVISYLGAATPRAAYWFRFFLGFVLAMTAVGTGPQGLPAVGVVTITVAIVDQNFRTAVQ
jgi:hypothetical protein